MSSDATKKEVSFQVWNPNDSPVTLKIYQPNGILIATIEKPNGTTISWAGLGQNLNIVEGGIYLYNITVGGVNMGSGTVVLAK